MVCRNVKCQQPAFIQRFVFMFLLLWWIDGGPRRVDWELHMMSPQTHSTASRSRYKQFIKLQQHKVKLQHSCFYTSSPHKFPPSIWTCLTERALLLQPLHQQLCGSISWIGILLSWPKYKTAACVPAAALRLAARQHERERGEEVFCHLIEFGHSLHVCTFDLIQIQYLQ